MSESDSSRILTDGSLLIIEAMVRAGADAYVGYPITPANRLYACAQQRFPYFLAAPDEISALQWSAGLASSGHIPVTGTSFPGFALMLETVNMAYMMELPIVIVLSQRLGPSTGSATTGAQGDLLLLRGAISGGSRLPVLCPSNMHDCWTLAAEAVHLAANLRTPVVLLTSKEMVMNQRSMTLGELPSIAKVPRKEAEVSLSGPHESYAVGGNGVPVFHAVGNPTRQVRLNASTHGKLGLIQKDTPEALDNTRRLDQKIVDRLAEFSFFEFWEGDPQEPLVISYGITSEAARDAVASMNQQGSAVSLLVLKTLIPIPGAVLDIIKRFPELVIAEENETGLLAEYLFGLTAERSIHRVNRIGKMIYPDDIVQEVEACRLEF